MKTHLKSKIGSGIIVFLLLVIFNIDTAAAHGIVYETSKSPSGGNNLRITLKQSDPAETRGISIVYYHSKNGKTLNIGYELKDNAPAAATLDYDLTSALQPIRIILTKAYDIDWRLFDDIKDIEAEEYIRHLHDAGIISGYPGSLYKPDNNISRAEFAVMLVKALGLTGNAGNSGGYTDIGRHWAKNAIYQASAKGLLSGYEDKTFRPDNPITLAEVSVVIGKAFSFKTIRKGIYDKLKGGAWYSTYVRKMFDTGILSVSDSLYRNFSEQSYINRANCSIMVSRALSTY